MMPYMIITRRIGIGGATIAQVGKFDLSKAEGVVQVCHTLTEQRVRHSVGNNITPSTACLPHCENSLVTGTECNTKISPSTACLPHC